MGQIDTNPRVYASGSANAFSVIIDGPGYYDGQKCTFLANHTIDGAATISFSGRTAIAIKKQNDQALVSGDIEDGQWVEITFNELDNVFEMLSVPAWSIRGATGVTGSTGAGVTWVTWATWATGSTWSTGSTWATGSTWSTWATWATWATGADSTVPWPTWPTGESGWGGTAWRYEPALTFSSGSGEAYEAHYSRVWNEVTVFWLYLMTGSSTGTTTIWIALPIASNFDNTSDCIWGMNGKTPTTAGYWNIQADTTNDRAVITTGTELAMADPYTFSFMYTVK